MGLFSLENRRCREDLITLCNLPGRRLHQRGCLFSQVTSDKIRGNSHRLSQGRDRISVMERVAKNWNRLPMEVTEFLSLEINIYDTVVIVRDMVK